MTSGTSKMLDKFFNLGNKATAGDPVRKAYFDYCLYWIVFLTFVFLSLYNVTGFIFRGYPVSSFAWGIVIGIFSWFNYWALISFRMAYLNMKKFYSQPKQEPSKNDFEEIFKEESN